MCSDCADNNVIFKLLIEFFFYFICSIIYLALSNLCQEMNYFELKSLDVIIVDNKHEYNIFILLE